MKFGAGYRAVYASKAVFAVLHLIFNSLITETLPVSERRPLSGFKSVLT